MHADISTLQIRNLHVSRGGKPVLHGVTIAVHSAGVTALLGANGAGKSSLILSIAGLLATSSGEVSLNGLSLLGKRPEDVRQLGVATVLEQQQVFAGLSVIDNMRAAGYQLSRRALQLEIDRILEIFPELKPKLHTSAGQLSGGQMRMLTMSQALMGSPRFLLIDELSLGLAPVIVQRLAEVIRKVAQSGVGILLIEQFTPVALGLASEVCVLERGKIVFSGNPQQLEQQPDILHSAYLR